MAYGKGKSNDLIRRAVDPGMLPTLPEFSSLRSGILTALATMAASIWPDDILQPIPHGKEIDAVMLRVQSDLSKRGLNSVWGEKARLLAKSAVLEQWKRAQRTLFGMFKNVGTAGDQPMADGVKRLVNFPEEFSRKLTADDIEQLNDLAVETDFASMLELFRQLGCGNCGLTSNQADALRAMLRTVRERLLCPAWKADAIIQLHLDYRCLRGGKAALSTLLEALGNGVLEKTSVAVDLQLTSASPRCDSIVLPMRLRPQVSIQTTRHGKGQIRPTSLLVELGPHQVRPKMVVVRPPDAPPVAGCRTVVAEDFGFTNTSSIVVLRGPTPIGEPALTLIGGHNGGEQKKVTKTQAKAYLRDHVSADDVEVLESVQFDGRDFLGRVTSVKIPSFYTSTTDWRNGKVDKDQRRGAIFRAALDGRVWDADLHAAEMIGRYLFLKPKSESSVAALAA